MAAKPIKRAGFAPDGKRGEAADDQILAALRGKAFQDYVAEILHDDLEQAAKPTGGDSLQQMALHHAFDRGARWMARMLWEKRRQVPPKNPVSPKLIRTT